MEDSGLVKVLWLHSSADDAVACGVTTHKPWSAGAQQLPKVDHCFSTKVLVKVSGEERS